jgi:lipopolysaccharide transport system permease protein/teichoic acid transport system permease protein
MIRLLRNAWQHRHLLISLVERDISGSYSGSILGKIWAFIDPMIYVLLTMFFFQFAIRGVETEGVPYVAWVLPQIMFWTFISGVVNAAVNSVKEYSFLLRHRDFELRLIALIKLGAGLVIHLFLLAILMVVLYGFLGVRFGFATLRVLYYLASMCTLLVAMNWIIGSLGVFLKDVRNIVSIVMQVEFWISPIFWTPERFPPPVAAVMYLNPFYYPMQGYRQSVLMAAFGHHYWLLTVYFWIVVVGLLFFGSRLFRRLSRSFGDVL